MTYERQAEPLTVHVEPGMPDGHTITFFEEGEPIVDGEAPGRRLVVVGCAVAVRADAGVCARARGRRAAWQAVGWEAEGHGRARAGGVQPRSGELRSENQAWQRRSPLLAPRQPAWVCRRPLTRASALPPSLARRGARRLARRAAHRAPPHV